MQTTIFEHDAVILKRENPSLTNKEIAIKLQLTPVKVGKILKEAGFVRQSNVGKLMIKNLLKPEVIKKEIYPRELCIAKKLLSEYPDVEFWKRFNLWFKLNSLAYLIGDGKKELKRRYAEFNFEIPITKTYNEVNVFAEKNGKDYIEAQKPKTLKDFLKK